MLLEHKIKWKIKPFSSDFYVYLILQKTAMKGNYFLCLSLYHKRKIWNWTRYSRVLMFSYDIRAVKMIIPPKRRVRASTLIH